MISLADKPITYDLKKNLWLIEHRNISFPEIMALMADGNIIAVIAHPNKEKYSNQSIMVLDLGGYPWCVPYAEEDDHIFLKTAFPARQYKQFMEEHYGKKYGKKS